MKLIRDFTSEEHAETFALKLISRGIPVHYAVFRGDSSHHYAQYGGGAKTWAVWVLIDDHYDDAIKLIKGRRHEVRNPLSEEEMAQFYKAYEAAKKKKLYIFMSILGACLLIPMCFVAFLIYSRL